MEIEISSLLNKMTTELKLKNYSTKTRCIYLACLKQYFLFKKMNFKKLDQENIKKFLCQKFDQNYAARSIHIYLYSIKFFYNDVLHYRSKIQIPLPKRPNKLPVILSHDEISKLIDTIKNNKHKLLISIAYGSGLRLNEVLNLKVSNLDFDRKVLYVINGKGKKDRQTIIPEIITNQLKIIAENKKFDDFLFSSNMGGRLSSRSAQLIFKKALKNAGIRKYATFHSLRHSFATHILENGTNLRYLQEILGHTSIRTTQLYTRLTACALSKIESPL